MPTLRNGNMLAAAVQVRVEDFSSYIGKLSTPRELVSTPRWWLPLRIFSAERCVPVTSSAQAVIFV